MRLALIWDYDSRYILGDFSRAVTHEVVANIILSEQQMYNLKIQVFNLSKKQLDGIVIATLNYAWIIQSLKVLRQFNVECPVLIAKRSTLYHHLPLLKIFSNSHDVEKAYNEHMCMARGKNEGIESLYSERMDILDQGASEPYLYHVNVHICDYCNLNCKGCNHFSPFCKERVVSSSRQWESDAALLSKSYKLDHIEFVGGEPLLEPETVEEFVEITRKCLPQTEIYLLTNGLLITKMKPKFWEFLVENSVTLHMSVYPALFDSFQDVCELLDGYNVNYTYHKSLRFQKFLKRLPNDKRALINNDICWGRACYTVHDGCIYKCPLIPFSKYLDSSCGMRFQTDCGISLEETVKNPFQTLEKLSQPSDLCKYCDMVASEYFDWEKCSGKPDISDWLNTPD